MTITFAGIAQDRAPATSLAGGGDLEFVTRSTIFDRPFWQRGKADALAGRPWALTAADLLDRGGDRRAANALSYIAGYRAGELERRSGGDAVGLAGGREER